MVHTYWLNWSFGSTLKNWRPNNRLKRDCQRVAFPVPLSRGGFGCCD
ncbi:transcriptional regulator [Vibrio cholerae]|nr:transcriptional regulator [Vibrio cholerae]MCD1200566.1 transcriptional regulator [Vibrio cholerae]MCD1209458.1 transcriptional regulator [Vibrio cholerae]MCD1213157.1 transcriptional regulator [Vibrio cholerae]MCD1216919.1 transcriptional regulator [Vibrio cholerae]